MKNIFGLFCFLVLLFTVSTGNTSQSLLITDTPESLTGTDLWISAKRVRMLTTLSQLYWLHGEIGWHLRTQNELDWTMERMNFTDAWLEQATRIAPFANEAVRSLFDNEHDTICPFGPPTHPFQGYSINELYFNNTILRLIAVYEDAISTFLQKSQTKWTNGNEYEVVSVGVYGVSGFGEHWSCVLGSRREIDNENYYCTCADPLCSQRWVYSSQTRRLYSSSDDNRLKILSLRSIFLNFDLYPCTVCQQSRYLNLGNSLIYHLAYENQTKCFIHEFSCFSPNPFWLTCDCQRIGAIHFFQLILEAKRLY
ncbi:hypothetical protein RFI_07700 [Reticulomyxa filosa]|uniref:SCP domain-containing protein n=1 Tax=Reticulomyxa filosa TaxID=46433 RepID=X6NUG3_RETFI|nr:hypothetical protein RFI_07700 [Reticulomyxa filosa]|eukprot:ETO29419.1 hypothetical protein RFI_07700 [Reticulomyxa filosa]